MLIFPSGCASCLGTSVPGPPRAAGLDWQGIGDLGGRLKAKTRLASGLKAVTTLTGQWQLLDSWISGPVVFPPLQEPPGRERKAGSLWKDGRAEVQRGGRRSAVLWASQIAALSRGFSLSPLVYITQEQSPGIIWRGQFRQGKFAISNLPPKQTPQGHFCVC